MIIKAPINFLCIYPADPSRSNSTNSLNEIAYKMTHAHAPISMMKPGSSGKAKAGKKKNTIIGATRNAVSPLTRIGDSQFGHVCLAVPWHNTASALTRSWQTGHFIAQGQRGF
jgi:hypothetical protein